MVQIFILVYGSSLGALNRTMISDNGVFSRLQRIPALQGRDMLVSYESAEVSLNLGGNTDSIFALSVSTFRAFLF